MALPTQPVRRRIVAILFALSAAGARLSCAETGLPVHVIPADVLEDKIRGGMLAQIIGNLNGLPHEMKYIDEPGQIDRFTPSLPDGARTDDDTDLEWVYLHEIARGGKTLIPPKRIAELWKSHINRRIWCANKYARRLFDLGFEPPWTGNETFNPWSEFNISGQFVCESFGLMAPAMPQTAARIGLHYTRTTIDGEPAQTTQLFTTMIALAFIENDVDKLLDAGLTAVDPNSRTAEIVREVRAMCVANPDDWRKTRGEIKRRWQTHGGEMRDRNGYELNTASTIAALIYGQRPAFVIDREGSNENSSAFVETLRLAFNFGWDCDNNAATAATIVGVMKGRRWMDSQGWRIADIYRNTTRDKMPTDETLTSLENKVIQCARIAIREQGGELTSNPTTSGNAQPQSPPPTEGGDDHSNSAVYRITTQSPANIEPLATARDQFVAARDHFLPRLADDLSSAAPANARAAYIAICLDEAANLKRENPAAWSAAIAELARYKNLLDEMHKAPESVGIELREKARQAGLSMPLTKAN